MTITGNDPVHIVFGIVAIIGAIFITAAKFKGWVHFGKLVERRKNTDHTHPEIVERIESLKSGQTEVKKDIKVMKDSLAKIDKNIGTIEGYISARNGIKPGM